MLTLYLCRHAKSSWDIPGQRDFDRPLNERGLRNAPFMANLFRERGEPLDLLVSSTAERAMATARHFAKALGAREGSHFDPDAPKPQLLPNETLYLAGVRDILLTVNGLPDEATRVMLFGHNPGFTDALDHISGTDIGNLPTCGIVRIDLPLKKWAEVSRDLGTLVWSDAPKRHPDQG